LLDDIGGEDRDFIKKGSVNPEENPEFAGHRKGDMLPVSLRESIKFGLNPDVGSFLAARWTKAGFAGMRSRVNVSTGKAFINMIPQKRSSAGKEFQDIDNNGGSYEGTMFDKQLPPVAIMKKNIPEFNFTADEFHSGIIQKY
jgi:hypothetical protein